LASAAGFKASLPLAVFDLNGTLLEANSRMLALFGLSTEDLPVPVALAESRFPFHNETSAGPALFREVLGTSDAGSFIGEAKLKTYKLRAKHLAAKKRLVFEGELVRSGDLLNDKASRQALFRSISHEIRTSVMALDGFCGMLQVQSELDREIVKRMRAGLERLHSVVSRLEDFKAELGIRDPE